MDMARRVFVALISILGLLMIASFGTEPTELPREIVGSFSFPGISPQDLSWNHETQTLWVLDDIERAIYEFDEQGNLLNKLLVERITGWEDDSTQSLAGLAWFDGLVWIGETNAHGIRGISLSERRVEVVFSMGELQPLEGVRTISLIHSDLVALASDGESLWVEFLAGYSSSIYQLDIAEGSATEHYWTPGTSPVGITLAGDTLWGMDELLPASVRRVGMDGAPTGEFFLAPGQAPHGITFDGQYFWISDAETKTIYRVWVPQVDEIFKGG